MLRILSAKKQRLFYEQHLGTTRNVLFEADSRDNVMHGFTDNYIKIKTGYDPGLINQLKELKLSALDADGSVLVEDFKLEACRLEN